jgi:amidohydrolase
MTLLPGDIAELTALRRSLHRHPEVSGHEAQTAAAIVAATAATAPDHTLTGLGGHGVALVYGQAPGPTVLIRAELDALPITEQPAHDHGSLHPGVAHLCGHDGHATILAGLARLLHRRPPARGRVILLFQPAEEDGSGAAAVMADPRWPAIAPDWAFALHNLPGLPFGRVVLEPGPANCASVGLKIVLQGRESHAAQPERGISPAPALADLVRDLAALGPGGVTAPDFRLVTLTHMVMGTPAFGIAPGGAEIRATLRTLTDDRMGGLKADALAMAARAAQAHGLTLTTSWHDDFAACTNHPAATARLRAAVAACGVPLIAGDMPLRASEDFGRFCAAAPQAMLYLGAGEGHPALHNPDYDFPDDLIPTGIRIFDRVIRDILG